MSAANESQEPREDTSTLAPFRTIKRTVLRTWSAESSRRELHEHVLCGLAARPKKLSSRFFYDDAGSEIFDRISALETYYPSRTEAEILQRLPSPLFRILESHSNLHGRWTIVELGAGNGEKTRPLISALHAAGLQFEYAPVDISGGALSKLEEAERIVTNGVNVHAREAEYIPGLRHAVTEGAGRRNLVLFMGSNIGNFQRKEAVGFLKELNAELNDGDLILLGCDLRKRPEILIPAYSDPEGVTKEFNLNLLRRINREIGTNFDEKQFAHYATYNPLAGAMQSFLLSRCQQTVCVPCAHKKLEKKVFSFDDWEPIFVETSEKYTIGEVHKLMRDANFVPVADFLDSRGWFLDAIGVATKKRT